MPLYDYRCQSCGHAFELRQSFHADPVTACPQCQGEAQRKIHAVGVIFKGSGWYVTDYGRKNTAASSNGSKDSADEQSPAGSSESDTTDSSSSESMANAPAATTSGE